MCPMHFAGNCRWVHLSYYLWYIALISLEIGIGNAYCECREDVDYDNFIVDRDVGSHISGIEKNENNDYEQLKQY